jgi:hypothetical protein
MSELLCRGWNVAVPEVDVGDDVFVVRDQTGDFHRVQVKAANARVLQSGYSAQFRVPRRQLVTPVEPELTYVFATRHAQRWDAFVVIDRSDLADEHERGVGSVAGESVQFYVSFQIPKVTCGGRDFAPYLNAWGRRFPVIIP